MTRSGKHGGEAVRVEFKLRRDLLERLDEIATANYNTRSEAIIAALLGWYRPLGQRYEQLVLAEVKREGPLWNQLQALAEGEEAPQSPGQ